MYLSMSNGRFFSGKSIRDVSGVFLGAVGDVVVGGSIGRLKVDGIEPCIVLPKLALDCRQSVGIVQLHIPLEVLSSSCRALFDLSDEESDLVASIDEFSELREDIENGEGLS
jgi:hypothetical protein